MVKSEAKIQQEIVLWFRNNNLGTNNIIFSVPNHKAGNESTGQLNGVSDLIVVQEDVFFIEIKTPKQIDTDGKVYLAGKQSEAQLKFESKVKANNFTYRVVTGLDDFIELYYEIIKK